MGVSREQIERALEAAKADQNATAVAELEGMLNEAEGVRPRDPALPAHMDQDPIQVEGALSGQPEPVEQGALRKPTPEQPWTKEEYALAGQRQQARESELVTAQYKADQELARDPANRPTQREMNEFIRDNANTKYGASMVNSMMQQMIRDPKTGKVRWTAMSPEMMDRIDSQGETTRAVVGALGFGSVRPAANIVQGVDEGIERVNNFQRYLIRQLPPSEVERIQGRANEQYGSDSKYSKDLGLVPASVMAKWIDENPDNHELLDGMAGDEWWEGRKENWARWGGKVLTSMRNALPWADADAGALNPFGADDPEGALFGSEAYQGIDYEGKMAPAYPGASDDVRDWRAESERDPGIYEHIVKPWLTDGGKMPGDRLMGVAEGIIQRSYSEQQLEERKMPFFSEDVQVEGVMDLFNPDLYTDPNTKLPWNNLEAFALTFFESAPEMALSMGLTRGAGGLGARQAAGSIRAQGMTLEQMDKMRRRHAAIYGGVTGSASEGYFVANAVEQEVRDTLNEVPIEKFREDPVFQELILAGLTEAEARQLLTQEAANIASKSAFVSTAMLSGPISAFIGKAGAGRLLKDKAGTRWAMGTTGEMGTEGAQGLGEQLMTEMGVATIDPENPIFDNPNRYLEAFGGEAMVAGPIGALASIETGSPVGIEKMDVEAARATADFMNATNARFKFETQISDPEYINNTSPNKRMADLERLEQLQLREAEATLSAEPAMRAHLEKQPTSVAKTELQMLDRLVMRANAMKNDIAVARSQRTTASELRMEEQRVMQDRADLQRKVNDNIIKLEDIERMAGGIEAVQNMEAISSDTEAELVREGYAKRSKDGNLVVLPKGKRAMKELNRQARGLRDRLQKGYTGPERRDPMNQVQRDVVESAGPVEREQMLYEDQLTGGQNRRAFNERQENIDVKEGQEKRTIVDAQPAVAAVDVDSLKWVNDNMSHSAGDRMLVAVSDALSKQKGVEVFRLGGDEFAVTGASEAALEEALQSAARELAKTEVIAGEDVVTPTITWGKGADYKTADTEAVMMKEDRQARNVIGERKGKPSTYRHRAQQGLFMKDESQLPTSWQGIKNVIERGDSIELLTPDGAVQGVVTNVTNRRGRPRVRVTVQGRSFLFNPENNHLIVSNSSPQDIAWITGDAEYAQPERGTLPQVIGDVMIGHVGKQGAWYADLGRSFEYIAPPPWWIQDTGWSQYGFDQKVFGVRPMPEATIEEMNAARAVTVELIEGYNNLPQIHLVESWDQLERDAPDIAAQIRAEGGSPTGVRGYMDHIGHTGIYVFVPNISGIVGSDMFEMGVAETVAHEMIGHYGVRGFFGDEIDLREWMHETVDTFPRLAKHYAGRLGLDITDPADKQLLGEEMVAYIAGEVFAGKVDFTPKERSFWQRIVQWFRDLIRRKRLDRFAPLKKMVTLNDTKQDFWTDKRIAELISRSQDFLRNGNGFEWRALNGASMLYQRDGDIFQSGVVNAINTGTKTLNKNARKQLAQKYGGLENVPKETALFPDSASPNAYIQAIDAAKKEKFFTERDLELSGLSENSDFYLFRDGTYGTLKRYVEQMNGGVAPEGWYRGVLPKSLADELDAINDAMAKDFEVGPLKEGYTERERRLVNVTGNDIKKARIEEIMREKIDPKQARLTKEMLLGHMASENVFRVYVEPSRGYPSYSYDDTVRALFGNLSDAEMDALTDEQKQQIKDEQKRIKERGPYIGYDKEQDRWLDASIHSTEYSEWAPQGSRYTRDYRIALIKTAGKGGDMGMGRHSHFDRNLMHIRTGVAELLNEDMFEGMEWPNPEVQGQLLSLIELQSDWLQAMRKGFTSGDERDNAERQVISDRKLLNMAGDQMGKGIAAEMFAKLLDGMTPIANLPSDVTSETRGRLFAEMDARSQLVHNKNWSELTEDQRLQIWSDTKNAEIDKITQPWRDMATFLDGVERDLPNMRDDLPGTMDARAFEMLDAVAVRRVVNVIRGEVNTVIDELQSNLKFAASQKGLVDKLNDVKRRVGVRLNKLASGTDYMDSLRLPMTGYMLKPILTGAFKSGGLNEGKVDELMAGLESRERVIVRIPKEPIRDLNTAMKTRWESKALLEEIVNPARISRHSDVEPGKLGFHITNAGDNFIDIEVVGDKGAVSQVEALIPKLIDTWIDDHAQEKLNINRESMTNMSRIGQNGLRSADDYSFSDLEDAYDIETHDTEDGDRWTRDYMVTTYMEFEESERTDIESDVIDEAFNNITEAEWDRIEDDFDGVSRQGEEYRSRLVVDEDGDVDNDEAERYLDERRSDYRTEELWQDESLMDQVYDQLREMWYERGPTALLIGSLPVEWDSDGDAINHVQIMIRAKEPGDAYDIYIDDDEVNWESTLDDAKDSLSVAVHGYYEDQGITPPVGQPFGPETRQEPAAQPQPESVVNPNWDIAKGNVLENLSMMSDEPQVLSAVFERMVTTQKKIDGGVYQDTPLSKDEQWRPIAFKYLVADAVRRGLGGVMWNAGTASSARGGWTLDISPSEQITWSKEVITTRGKEQEVYVINQPGFSSPLVLAANRLVPALGADVAYILRQQEAGKMESAEIKKQSEDTEAVDPRDNYIFAPVGDDYIGIYRRSNNEFLGFERDGDTDAIQSRIQDDLRHYGATAIPDRPDYAERNVRRDESIPLGKILAGGTITQELVGGPIYVAGRGRVSGYKHTFGQPRTASARQSYEDITVRLFNKELKKYGVQIKQTYVKAKDMRTAKAEGQASLITDSREEKIAEEHGRLYIAETEGPVHHWVVMSEKKGPIVNDVYDNKEYAQERLDRYIEDNYGAEGEGVKVFYFPITEQMREDFSGPVAPFHYDPTEDPALKTAAKKIGYKKTPLRERVQQWRRMAGAEMRQGMVDQFYGLKRALNQAGIGDGAYISARLTTSLDSMMKAVLFHGNPIWSEGIVQTEGRGLMDILAPVLDDPDTWGLFMAGRRSKRLMMEGYDALTPEQKALIDDAAEQYGGGPEGVFEVLAQFHGETLYDHVPVKAGDLTQDELNDLSQTERKFWADFLPHTKRSMQPKKGSTTKAPGGRWQIWDWRVPDARNTQAKIDAKYRQAIKALMGKGFRVPTEADARDIVDKLTDLALEKQRQANELREKRIKAGKSAAALISQGRENLFKANEIKAQVALGEKFSHFKRVAADYAEFNRKLLDFAEASGIIDAESRPMWENADYVPFYRVDDDRLIGSGMSPQAGIANQRAPIRRLRGGEQNVNDILGNIMMNVTKLVDASVKNNAALESIDALRGSGIVSKRPLDYKPAIIPLAQLKKVLLDRGVIVPDDQPGIHMSDIPKDALQGFQKMFAITPPEGPGILSVMRNGKREYYQTDDMLLWRAMGSINKKQFGNWINLFRAPKRLVTTMITIDPSFMIANFIRDTGSAFVIGRDRGNIPVLSALEGFGKALFESEELRTMLAAGAAFESGYVTGGDPRRLETLISEAADPTLLNTPKKLLRAWMHIGSSVENSNRIAIYNAALRNGKSKKRAAFEAKDLMDFSMGGDWGAVQFLIQTVPFMNARLQGLYRLGRGAVEHPVSFTLKGMLVGLAGMAVYLMFKDDERYKELPMWDRHAYYHWWIGDVHYRLPKPFEVGALFNTIPEIAMNAHNSEETDAGKVLMREFGHMIGETFSMNPLPQTVAPMVQSGINYNFFRQAPIVSYYEQKRLPPDQYRYRTSPFWIEVGKRLPSDLDTISGKIRSPLHLQNLWAGYTGTIGRYMNQAADALITRELDYPLPPAMETQDIPVYGRFVRGTDPTRNTKYEDEVYRLLDKTTAIQGSLNFHEKQGNVEQYLETHNEYEPYIRAADDLEKIRENIQDVNRAIQQIYLDPDMDREQKKQEINLLEETRNQQFKEAWKLRPGGEYNPLDAEPVSQMQIIDMIDNWGVDNSTAFMRHIQERSPDTYELLDMINSSMDKRQLASLARQGRE